MGLFIHKNAEKSPIRNQMLYALFVVIVIPLILIINSLWLMDRFNRILDTVSQKEAAIAHDIITSLSLPEYLSAQEMSTSLAKIAEENSRVKGISYLTKNSESDTKYTLYASSQSEAGTVDVGTDLVQFISENDQPYIGLTKNSKENIFVWTIVSKIDPLVGDTEGIVVMNLDATDVQVFLSDISSESLVVLVVLIVFILLLLVNHLRFYDYSLLYTQLKQVDQMKDDFFSTASHEIRTPLTSIAGYASLAMDEISDTETVKHSLQVILTSSSRLSGLVENLLDISRIEQGRIALNLKRVSLVQSVNSVFDELLLQVQEKGLSMEHLAPSEDIFVTADPDKLKQVLYNIVGNAIKYTIEGKIVIEYLIENECASLIVKDTGIGMTAEQKSKIFSKFYRAQDDKTREVHGTGLGLWITKQIVELMKGSIVVESEYGKGTKFIVSFKTVQ
jgi:signal transduction histidine kinase